MMHRYLWLFDCGVLNSSNACSMKRCAGQISKIMTVMALPHDEAWAPPMPGQTPNKCTVLLVCLVGEFFCLSRPPYSQRFFDFFKLI